MKIRVQEQHPGELVEKAEDVVRVLEKLAGRSLLKADSHSHEKPVRWLPALKASFDARSTEADRIAEVMKEKLLSALE